MEINEKDLQNQEMIDPLDLMAKTIKVHTENIGLNEDATLSNLDKKISRQAKYVTEQIAIVGILQDFYKSNITIIKYSNMLETWGKEKKYINPELEHFKKTKAILMNKVHSIMILTRAIEGKPLKAFLNYGTPKTEPEITQKTGIIGKMFGKKDKVEEENVLAY